MTTFISTTLAGATIINEKCYYKNMAKPLTMSLKKPGDNIKINI